MSVTVIDTLSRLMGRIPGIGPRSARRIVLFLLRNKQSLLEPLIENFTQLNANIRKCICGNLDEIMPCNICSDINRDNKIMCVVEDVTSLWAIERSGSFSGLYHVLDGVLSPIAGIGPAELKVDVLINRVKSHCVQEIVIALNPTVEGRATAYYLREMIDIKCSVLRVGVPIGGELDYLDNGTIAAALNGRDYSC